MSQAQGTRRGSYSRNPGRGQRPWSRGELGSSHGQSAWRAGLQVVVCAQSEDRQPDANREGAEATLSLFPGSL